MDGGMGDDVCECMIDEGHDRNENDENDGNEMNQTNGNRKVQYKNGFIQTLVTPKTPSTIPSDPVSILNLLKMSSIRSFLLQDNTRIRSLNHHISSSPLLVHVPNLRLPKSIQLAPTKQV